MCLREVRPPAISHDLHRSPAISSELPCSPAISRDLPTPLTAVWKRARARPSHIRLALTPRRILRATPLPPPPSSSSSLSSSSSPYSPILLHLPSGLRPSIPFPSSPSLLPLPPPPPPFSDLVRSIFVSGPDRVLALRLNATCPFGASLSMSRKEDKASSRGAASSAHGGGTVRAIALSAAAAAALPATAHALSLAGTSSRNAACDLLR